MMVKSLNLCISLFFAIFFNVAANPYCYRVYLDGKPGSEPVVLSERAQLRRMQQAIDTDEADYSVSEDYLQRLREVGLVILTRSRWLNTAVVMRMDSLAIEDTFWNDLPFVQKAEILTMPVIDAPVTATTFPDIRTRSTIEEDNYTTPLREVNAYESLYLAGHRGKGMLIAVFDGGFCGLKACDYLMDKVDFYHDMYAPADPEQTFGEDSHGIQCVSIMACPENIGVCGTAQEARYCLFHTEKSDYEFAIEEDMWVAAAEMADSLGVDIISSSLGYYEFDGGLLSHTHDELAQDLAFVSRGARIAAEKGMLVCCSAGNEAKKDWKQIIFPADTKEILSVGATTSELMPTSFTSIGFLSPYVKPDVSARGQNCYTIVPTDDGGFEVRNNGAGTSFSSPLVAGLCASLWCAVPTLTAAEIRQIVSESASDYHNPTVETGYGLPDFAIALQKAKNLHPSTIEQITNEAAATESTASRYFNMMGQPLSAPPAEGMFIDRGRVIVR